MGPNPETLDVDLGPEMEVSALVPARATMPLDVSDPGDHIPANTEVVEALSSISWPRTLSRPNVSTDAIEAMCLGMSWSWSQQSANISAATISRPNLTKLLTNFAARIPDKGFTYTCVQLNRDYNAMVHTDSNNLGPSFIIGLGEYTGGELFVHEESGERSMEAQRRMLGYSFLPGDTIPGKFVHMKEKWVEFDGRLPQAARHFEGTRFSLVYSTSKYFNKLSEDARAGLHAYGFPVPRPDVQGHDRSGRGSTGDRAEGTGSNRKVPEARLPASGTYSLNMRPDARGRSPSPDKEVRFSKEKFMISHGVDRPPCEALSHDTARVLPLVARQFFRFWMLDTGASYDVIRRRDLTATESAAERDATIVTPLRTAAGQISANRVVTAYVNALSERIPLMSWRTPQIC